MQLDIEDAESLVAYLRQGGRIAPDELPACEVLAGGVSNRTVLVRRSSSAGDWVLKQALEKLRVEVDWYSDPARVHREAAGLRRLGELLPPGSVPEYLFEDQQQHVLAMRAVPEPHENWKSQLLAGQVESGAVRQAGRMLGTLHAESQKRRDPLADEFEDRAFFESLRLEPYYAFTAQGVPEAREFLESIIAETRRRRETLVHGDFSPKNILVHRGQLVLLDHEVIHWGDPAFDLGFFLTHLLSKARHLVMHRRALLDAALQFWQSYVEARGAAGQDPLLERRVVHHILACLLARVAGRSPLEYLSAPERGAQRQCVLELLPPRLDSVTRLLTAIQESMADGDR